LHGDIRAACPSRSPASAATSAHTANKSPIAPNVATGSLSPLDSTSVQVCGIIRLLPSGSTTNSSAVPCRRNRPSTRTR
jgi:hypothetical protein